MKHKRSNEKDYSRFWLLKLSKYSKNDYFYFIELNLFSFSKNRRTSFELESTSENDIAYDEIMWFLVKLGEI